MVIPSRKFRLFARTRPRFPKLKNRILETLVKKGPLNINCNPRCDEAYPDREHIGNPTEESDEPEATEPSDGDAG